MLAAYIDRVGDPSVIRWGPVPDPVAGAGQVIVRPEAVAVDHVDTLVRSGRWATSLAFPVAVGPDVTDIRLEEGALDRTADGFVERLVLVPPGRSRRQGVTGCRPSFSS